MPEIVAHVGHSHGAGVVLLVLLGLAVVLGIVIVVAAIRDSRRSR